MSLFRVLVNVPRPKKSFFGKKADKDGKYKFGSYKYSAAKLKEKGVLLAVDGVTDESQ